MKWILVWVVLAKSAGAEPPADDVAPGSAPFPAALTYCEAAQIAIGEVTQDAGVPEDYLIALRAFRITCPHTDVPVAFVDRLRAHRTDAQGDDVAGWNAALTEAEVDVSTYAARAAEWRRVAEKLPASPKNCRQFTQWACAAATHPEWCEVLLPLGPSMDRKPALRKKCMTISDQILSKLQKIHMRKTHMTARLPGGPVPKKMSDRDLILDYTFGLVMKDAFRALYGEGPPTEEDY